MSARSCSTPGCTRRSVRPEPYQQLCARHYRALIVKAQQDASARFAEHIAALRAS